MSGERAGGCECGAAAPCADTWHEALAYEQGDQSMYSWHLPLVNAFILQHRSYMLPRYADGQFRMLEFYVDKGIEATNRLARHQVARNAKSTNGFDPPPPWEPYAALPPSIFPHAFALSVHDLRDPSGGFVGDGYPAYGIRVHRLAEATIDAWISAAGA